ncbi:MAG: pilus assembly protein [Bdellovibrio sp.]|nr:MAG: pilus assembly protein [Bdellovibrio sp.]
MTNRSARFVCLTRFVCLSRFGSLSRFVPLSRFAVGLLVFFMTAHVLDWLDGQEARAQELPSPAEETVKEPPKKKKPRRRKFLSLTLGVEADEKLNFQVKEPKPKGDYKRVVKVEYSPEINSLRLTPIAEGIATLQIYDKKDPNKRILSEFRLEVRKSRLDSVAREIKSLLGDIEGITIKIVNNKVIVDGQIVIPKDMNRIYTVVQQYGDQATSLVTMSPLAQKRIAEFIEKDIGNPEVRVRALNDKFILEGMVNNDEEKTRAEIVAKTYVQPVFLEPAEREGVLKKPRPANDGIINLINVRLAGPPPTPKHVQIVVHYVELSKSYQKGFRFQFTPNLQDNSHATFSTGNTQSTSSGWALTGIIDNLFPKLNWSKQHNYARVLESSTLIIQDGKKGVLNSVQEVPYQTAAGLNGSVPVTAFKDVGIATAITPITLNERSDSISLSMEFDISALVGMTDQGPLTHRNKITTDLIIRSGQSAAIGGLITNGASTDYNKTPKGYPDNPIISLFASKAFQRNQSQFVVFVTPIIKSHASAGSEKVKRKFRLSQ